MVYRKRCLCGKGSIEDARKKEDKGGGFVGMRDVERQFDVLTVKETATAEGGTPYDG